MESTTERFLRSVSDRFAENGLGARGAAVLLLAAGVIAGVVLSAAVRRLLARRAALDRFAAAHALGTEDLALARTLAAAVGMAPLDVLVRVDLFERATALALAGAPPGDAADPAAGIARLRQALRFDRLPAHTPLLSTRELAPGTVLCADPGPRRAVLLSLDERALHVELEGPAAPAPGDVLALGILHAREARYAARCRVLEATAAPGGAAHVALAHDEAPERHQRRDFVRVAAEGGVSVRALIWPVAPPGARLDVTARLVDVSAGGLQVTSPAPLPVGLLVEVGFAVAGAAFSGLRAVVLSCVPAAGGGHHARLELRAMPPAERDRLVAAVGRAEVGARRHGPGEP